MSNYIISYSWWQDSIVYFQTIPQVSCPDEPNRAGGTQLQPWASVGQLLQHLSRYNGYLSCLDTKYLSPSMANIFYVPQNKDSCIKGINIAYKSRISFFYCCWKVTRIFNLYLSINAINPSYATTYSVVHSCCWERNQTVAKPSRHSYTEKLSFRKWINVCIVQEKLSE